MDATITLKLTPREFDLLRRAVVDCKERYYELGMGSSGATPDVRKEARTLTVELGNLYDKMK